MLAWAQQPPPTHNHPFWILSLLLLVSVQTALLMVVFRHKERHKRAKMELHQIKAQLERRVDERTSRLRSLNNELFEEVARHETTVELLHNTQTYLNSILNSLSSIIIGVTPEGYITHWNYAACRHTQLDHAKILGKNLKDLESFFPPFDNLLKAALSTSTPQHHDGLSMLNTPERCFNIAVYPLEDDISSGAVIRIDEVTDRVRLEAMMIQSEKMGSLGELAAGIAHEINNPLSVILQNTQNILRRVSPEQLSNRRCAQQCGIDLNKLHQYFQQRKLDSMFLDMIEAGERASLIVKSMLDFSHMNPQQHLPVDLVSLTRTALKLSKHYLTINGQHTSIPIALSESFSPGIPKVLCQPGEIQQVLLNILRNAAQSLNHDENNSTPQISVSLKCDQGYAVIEIADNGPGIPRAVLPHIFEPFYTTKKIGEGTGLGLSICYFIITERHAGHIEVNSNGEGCTFIIRLPLRPSQHHGRPLEH